MKVKIVGDGTPLNTRVEVDGKPMTNVTRVLFCADAEGGVSWLTLELEGGVEIDLDVDGIAKEKVKNDPSNRKPAGSRSH